MSPNSALCVLHFLFFLFLNQVEIANARLPDCKKACKKHRPAGSSGSYLLDCHTLASEYNHDQVECSHCKNCPKEICDKKNSVGLYKNVTLNCPGAVYEDDDDDDDKDVKPADNDNSPIYISLGGLGLVILIVGCPYVICFAHRRVKRRRQMERDRMQLPPPPPITGYPGFGNNFTYPPGYSGASTTSTVQQQKL